MKVVLLHDWLTGFRGGERVLEVFCEMFPTAPLYTLIHEPGSTSPVIENRKITTSFLNKIPHIHQHYRKLLPLFPLAVDQMEIEEEGDLILSSSHCVIKGIRKGKMKKHLSYIHSPMRYMYDQFDVYFGADAPFMQRMGAMLTRDYLQTWDRIANDQIDGMIGNSLFVQQRIKKYYHRDSMVIHPFVDVNDFHSIQQNPPMKENFYLMVTAFAPNKRVDLAIHAFNHLKLPLKIVGSGQLESSLKKLAGGNIEFLGNLPRTDIITLMAQAQGFIFPGVEDFGITPLESLAAGTPVIALEQGGVLETLDKTVAAFFHKAHPDDLIKTVKKYQIENYERSKLYDRANQFTKEQFKLKIQGAIKELLN